ncbi:MAG TPA: VOC family protein [Bacillales bacterium]|nr:VOC family protein [Bacillales bacterium]
MEQTQKSPVRPYIGTTFLHVKDLRKSAAFYSMMLGLPLLEERLNGGPIYWMELEGGTGMILDDNSVNKQDLDWDESKQHSCMFLTRDIDAAYEHVKNLGAKMVTERENPHQGLKFFRFRDLDGNVFMVTESDYQGEPIPVDENRRSPIKNRIKAVFVNVTDMENAAEWYSNLFGTDAELLGDGPVRNLKTEGGAELLLDSNRFLQGDDYKILLMLDTDDVDQAYLYLKENDVEIFKEIQRYDDVAFFSFKDPAGNVLMVCQELTCERTQSEG